MYVRLCAAQDELVDDVDSYAPFQYMLQFLLQPLLVACGSTPAGQTAPLLRKICSTLKRTADATVRPLRPPRPRVGGGWGN